MGESVDSLDDVAWITRAFPCFASPSDAIQTVCYTVLLYFTAVAYYMPQELF